jgi:hypothetical protein
MVVLVEAAARRHPARLQLLVGVDGSTPAASLAAYRRCIPPSLTPCHTLSAPSWLPESTCPSAPTCSPTRAPPAAFGTVSLLSNLLNNNPPQSPVCASAGTDASSSCASFAATDSDIRGARAALESHTGGERGQSPNPPGRVPSRLGSWVTPRHRWRLWGARHRP